MLIKKAGLKAVFLFPEVQAVQEKLHIVIRGKNLVLPEYRKGYLQSQSDEVMQKTSKEHLTTKWFAVDAAERYLVMSGDAYNRAVWQFATADGQIYNEIPTEKKYRLKASKLFGRTFPRVEIPADAVKARVFFVRKTDEETLALGNRLQIEYGLLPTKYESYREEKLVTKRMKGEACPVFFYWDGFWYQSALQTVEKEQLQGASLQTAQELVQTLLDSRKTKCLHKGRMPLEVGQAVYLEQIAKGVPVKPVAAAELAQYEEIEKAGRIRTGRYGVRHKLKESVPVYERIYDAKGLHFNFKHGEAWATPYENDFDRIFPWCDMRRCAVSFENGSRKVIYEGEPGYKADGSVGDVMVEIPKHYVRRVVENGYEEIAISAEPAEGFEIDPSFVTQDGVQDYLYVGAYFASKKGDALRSRKGAQISLYHSGAKFLQMAEANAGFEACDLFAVLTIQRLFVIESALIDVQAAMEGNVYMPYLIKDKMSTYYSLTDAEATNTIHLTKNSISDRYWVGDVVAVMNTWKDLVNPEYANKRRKVKERVINADKTVDITFSGKPVNLKAHETGMATLPPLAGAADGQSYAIGTKRDIFLQKGHAAFCYRGIENAWGGVWIVLSHCSVKDSKLTVEYPDGRVATMAYELPVQNVELTSKQFGDPGRMCVRELGYDPEHPLVALPSEIGNGASTCSYYCDAWYNQAAPDTKYIVTYGGAWDNMGYAGIFAFRASFKENQKIVFNGVRNMTRLQHLKEK